MTTPHQFWLAVHHLAEAYAADGMTPDERADNILETYSKMPPTVRRQVLGDLRHLVENLPDLYTLARGEATEAPEGESKRKSG